MAPTDRSIPSSARPTLAVSVEPEGSAVAVSLRGELDLESAPLLRRALEGVLTAEAPRVVVDLADLAFCDSTGLSELVLAHRKALSAGGRLELRGAQGPVARVLEVTNLDKVLHLVPGRGCLPWEASSS